MEIIISPTASKQLEKIGSTDRKKAAKKIESLLSNPLVGKQLQGEFLGQRSLRAWPLRIFYIFNSKSQTIEIIAIKYRGGAYK